MVTHDHEPFRMSASPLFCISDGRGAGDPPERASRSEAEENEHRPNRPGDAGHRRRRLAGHPDIRCLPCGTSMRLSNDAKGRDKPVAPAREKNALVGFEAAGGCERRPRKRLVGEGVRVRQYPPKQIEHHGLACGKGAKTDKDDAKNIASFMQFRPDAGRELPIGALRELRAHARSGPSSSKSEKRRERDRGPEEAGSGEQVRRGEPRAVGAVQPPDRQDREANTTNYHVRRDPAQDGGYPVLDTRDRFRRRPDADRRNAPTGADLQPQGRRPGRPRALRPRRRQEEGQALHLRRKGVLADGSCQAAIAALRSNVVPGLFAKRPRTPESPRGHRHRGGEEAPRHRRPDDPERNDAGSRSEREGVDRIRIRRHVGRDDGERDGALRRLQASRRRVRRRGGRNDGLGAGRTFAKPHRETWRSFGKDARMDGLSRSSS